MGDVHYRVLQVRSLRKLQLHPYCSMRPYYSSNTAVVSSEHASSKYSETSCASTCGLYSCIPPHCRMTRRHGLVWPRCVLAPTGCLDPRSTRKLLRAIERCCKTRPCARRSSRSYPQQEIRPRAMEQRNYATVVGRGCAQSWSPPLLNDHSRKPRDV